MSDAFASGKETGLPPSDQALIDRLRLRVQDRKRITTIAEQIVDYPITVYPPSSLEQVEKAEALLGFRLPGLIREIYLQVGNGGFGPGYGIIGLEGGYEVYGAGLAGNTQHFRSAEDFFAEVGWDEPEWQWTDRTIPYGYWGDNVMTSVDCAEPSLPVYSLDATVIRPHSSQTLRQWWLDWLEGRIRQY